MTPNDPKMTPKLSENIPKILTNLTKIFDQNGTETMSKSLKNNLKKN